MSLFKGKAENHKRAFEDKNIEESVKQAADYFDNQGVIRDTIILTRLTLEEILLFYKSVMDATATYDITFSAKLGQVRIAVTVPGPPRNPFDAEDNDMWFILEKMMRQFPDGPTWTYDERHQRNRILFEPFNENSLPRNALITLGYLKPHRRKLIFSLILQAIELALQIILPLVNARLVTAYTDSLFAQIILMALAILALEIINGYFYHLHNNIQQKIYREMILTLENDLANSILHTKLDSLDENGTGLFIQRMTVDASRLVEGFSDIATQLATIVKGIGLTLATLIIDPIAFVLLVLCFTTGYIIVRKQSMQVNEKDIRYRRASEELSSAVTEMVRGTRDVRLLGCEKPFLNRIGAGISNATGAQLEMTQVELHYHFIREIFDYIWNLAFLGYLGLAIFLGHITPVIAIVLFNYRTNVREVPANLGALFECIKQFNLSAGRIYAIMHNPEFPKENFGDIQLETCDGRVEFDQVTFSYYADSLRRMRKKVLNKVSFTVEPGETVAIVGKSGCGKSTILSLIEHLYEPTAGTIRIDGQDITRMSQNSIRGNITMVPQLPHIFNLSVKENLMLVNPNISDEEIREACTVTGIHDDIMALEDGYDTMVGEGGAELSGGQRQRLSIARALLCETPIMLFDESTSALDNISQARMMYELEQRLKNRTVIIVAHRLSAVIDVNRIIFVDNGQIVDIGTHSELLERCEAYRILYGSSND